MNLQRYLIAGIVTAVPLALTVYILILIIGLVDGVSQPLVSAFLGRPIPGLGILVTMAILIVLGMFVSFAVGRKVAELVDSFMLRIPLSRSIYSVAKNVIETFINGRQELGRVVLVRLMPDAYVIGFLTGRAAREISSATDTDLFNVFVPTTPNPTTGVLLMVPQDRILNLDMSFDKGMELVISAGMCASKENGVAVPIEEVGAKAREECLDRGGDIQS